MLKNPQMPDYIDTLLTNVIFITLPTSRQVKSHYHVPHIIAAYYA